MQALVKEPTKKSEFEVHAYIWSELRVLGINARGEVKVPFKDDSNRRAVCRFDLAIFDDGVLTGIIEVKAAKITHKKEGGWSATRQGKRYSEFGVPIALIYGQHHAEQFIEAARANQVIVWGYGELGNNN